MTDKQAIELTRRCVRCGFCLDACPTYRLTREETHSPRGRLRLMASVMTGEVPLEADIVHAIDVCLGCRACETACPSGVEYGHIVEHFRARIHQSGIRARLQTDVKRGLMSAMENPRVFATALAANRRFGELIRLGTSSSSRTSAAMPAPVASILSGTSPDATLMPDTPDEIQLGSLPEFSPAIGERRATVCILQGCVMRVLYARTNAATVRVLQHAGCDVLCPTESGCCGALDLHAGFMAEGVERARSLVNSLKGLTFDAFVVNSAGCGSTVRDYHHVLADDPVMAHDAAELAARTRDVSEFLDEIGLPTPLGRFDAVVTYHDACHLAHGQGVVDAPRRLLQRVPGLKLVPLVESDTCCGSAGTYNLTQPEMARRLLERKVDNIIASGASVVAMGNPGCMAWIARGLKERGSNIRVMHVVEILDEALQAAETSTDRG